MLFNTDFDELLCDVFNLFVETVIVFGCYKFRKEHFLKLTLHCLVFSSDCFYDEISPFSTLITNQPQPRFMRLTSEPIARFFLQILTAQEGMEITKKKLFEVKEESNFLKICIEFTVIKT